MPTSVDIKNLKINKLTEAQYDTAVQGGVIGENELSVLTDAELEQIQVSTLPTASADELGNIYQYVGTTDANYTNGYFYKCEGAGDPVVYSWVRVDVQPGSSLPSQTGNDGKFLITDGTNTSWRNTSHYLKIIGRTGVSEGGQLILDSNSGYLSSLIFKSIGSLNAALHYMNGLTITVNSYYPYVFATDGFRKNYTNYGALGVSSLPWDVTYTKALNSGPGANITVPATSGKLALQIDTMPTAASSYEGVIYQFTGTTDSTYTNGHFYKCVSDGADPATYSWEEVQLGGSGLPDQTGQSGKFLTTDGTDASWATLTALQNTATGTNSLTISGHANTQDGGVNIGMSSSGWKSTVSLGSGASGGDEYAVSIGASSSASQKRSIAIGHRARATAQHAIQIGAPADETTYLNNSDANTFKVGNANGNFELMDANGYIPAGRLKNAATAPATMPELTVAGWSNNTQSVTVTGVTASNIVFVAPAPASAADYAAAGIVCTAQGTDSLTFSCTTVPSNAITVNVIIMG